MKRATGPVPAEARVAIVRAVIDPTEVLALVGGAGDGAVLLFLGTVRDHADGRRVDGLRYEAYQEMAESVLGAIAQEAAMQIGSDRIAVVHRIGELEIGEVSVAIAVSSPHRAEAYQASRYVIEEIKKRLPVWKLEQYVDGEAAWVPGRALEAKEERAMIDGFGRRIEYLRVSVTDKCNLRCVYCMPEEGLEWLRKDELLSYEEIVRVIATMAPMGLRRVRITGGEPLVRRDLPDLARMITAVPGIDDLSLSTNAVLLEEHAESLRAAGVTRVNISLDSLRHDRIDAIARRPGSAPRIMAGLDAAERVGFDPIKVNVVLMRGSNDDEIADFAELTREHPWHIRFMEPMPTGSNLDLSRNAFISCTEALGRLRAIGELEPAAGPGGNGPATYYRFPGAPGTVGVITPMSHNYCERCNRMRLTANGQLHPCLFGHIETNLRDPLRRGEDLIPFIEETLRIKPERHWLVQGSDMGSGGLVALSQTGG